MESDEMLMRDCQKGHDAAFEELATRYRPAVRGMCRRILLDEFEADDATQHTFVKMWLNRENFIPDRAFWPWLRVIAVTTCLDHRRAVKRLREVPLDEGDPEAKQFQWPVTVTTSKIDAHEQAQFTELKAAFERCWSLMPTNQRALIQCVDWSDWKKSWSEMASM